MTARASRSDSEVLVGHTPRQRDRRQALGDLLEALTRSLDRRNDISLMRGAFEEMLRRVVPVRTVQLREAGSRWTNRPGAGMDAESIALEVPGSGRRSGGHARSDIRSRMPPWRVGLSDARPRGPPRVRWSSRSRARDCSSRGPDSSIPTGLDATERHRSSGRHPSCTSCDRRSSGSPPRTSPYCSRERAASARSWWPGRSTI